MLFAKWFGVGAMCRVSGVKCRALGQALAHFATPSLSWVPGEGVWCDVGYPVSGIRCPVPSVRCLVSGAR